MDIETPKEFRIRDYIFNIILGIILIPITSFFTFGALVLGSFVVGIISEIFSLGEVYANFYRNNNFLFTLVFFLLTIFLESTFFYWVIFTVRKDGGKSYAHKSALIFVVSGITVVIVFIIFLILGGHFGTAPSPIFT